jgi:hypothetical protein
MQLLSFWLDVHLWGVSPTAAYLHSLLSTLVTALLLSLVLARLTRSPGVSAAVALVWVALPSTIAVHSYLGTRHYIEGLGWSLAACTCLLRICQRPPHEAGIRDTLLLVLFAAAAMLSKEIYVTVLPAFIFLYALNHRRYALGAAAPALLLAYAGYRLALLGPALAYPVLPVSSRDYLRYLAVLPYTFAANAGGYGWYACLAGGAVWALVRERQSASKDLLLLFSLFSAGLLATYPTVAAVLPTYRTPGTWYRAVFISSTLALVAGCYLLARYAARSVQVAAFCLLIGILIPGIRATQAYWEGRFARAEAEGKFYLTHPDKLVYSEEDAYWFLPGLERLYGVARSHYINKSDIGNAHTKAMLATFSTIWRYREGAWTEDSDLYSVIASRSRD